MLRTLFLPPLLSATVLVAVTGTVMAFSPASGAASSAAKMLPGTGASAVCATSTVRSPLGY